MKPVKIDLEDRVAASTEFSDLVPKSEPENVDPQAMIVCLSGKRYS